MGLYKMRTGKDDFLFRVASIAHKHGIAPNTMTTLGLCFGIISGVLFMYRLTPFAFASGFLSVFCDVLDGTIARKFNLETSFGRVFDAVADRTCELAVVLGALAAGIIEPIGVIAIVGSTVLFSLRVVSQSYGLETNYVMFGRTERLVFILLGLILPFTAVSTVCFVVAGGFGFASSIQIIVFLSRRHLQMKKAGTTCNPLKLFLLKALFQFLCRKVCTQSCFRFHLCELLLNIILRLFAFFWKGVPP